MTFDPWALTTLVALSGWTALLVFYSRASLVQANALNVLHKLDAMFDDRVTRVVGRIQERALRPKAPTLQSPSQPPQNAAQDALRDIFGGQPLEPIDEQPDVEGV